jgi:hypothetical protein
VCERATERTRADHCNECHSRGILG